MWRQAAREVTRPPCQQVLHANSRERRHDARICNELEGRAQQALDFERGRRKALVSGSLPADVESNRLEELVVEGGATEWCRFSHAREGEELASLLLLVEPPQVRSTRCACLRG